MTVNCIGEIFWGGILVVVNGGAVMLRAHSNFRALLWCDDNIQRLTIFLTVEISPPGPAKKIVIDSLIFEAKIV